MAPPSHSDKRYLEKHGAKYRVVLSVPKKLQKAIGSTKLKRDLGTDSLAVANTLKWGVLAEMRAELQLSDKSRPLAPNTFDSAALALRSKILNASSDIEAQMLRDRIADKAEEILGNPVAQDQSGDYVYDQHRENTADRFFEIANGKKTPLDFHRETYVSHLKVKSKTLADDIRAFNHVVSWCVKERVDPYLEGFHRRHAVEFVDALPNILKTTQPRTINKYIARLSLYWKWMASRDYVATNIWEGRKLPIPHTTEDEDERPFTASEMKKLLSGEATDWMHDLMRIAALSGARIGAIVALRVGDCANGCFRFKPQKKETNYRLCPIHSELESLISRRVAGREQDALLFHDIPRSTGKDKDESSSASNAFTRYRRKIGVDARRTDNRRGRVNFHSFRRWFITEAERAGQPAHIISAVVGHKRAGMTLGVYSAGPSLDQAKICVESVRI